MPECVRAWRPYDKNKYVASIACMDVLKTESTREENKDMASTITTSDGEFSLTLPEAPTTTTAHGAQCKDKYIVTYGDPTALGGVITSRIAQDDAWKTELEKTITGTTIVLNPVPDPAEPDDGAGKSCATPGNLLNVIVWNATNKVSWQFQIQRFAAAPLSFPLHITSRKLDCTFTV